MFSKDRYRSASIPPLTYFNQHRSLSKQISDHFANLEKPAVLVCHGLGGVGKTYIATHYFNTDNTYSLCAWFNASGTEKLIEDYRSFSKQFTLPLDDKASDIEVINLVKTCLSAHNNWLLIYDNAVNDKMLKSFLPKNRGHILITSRYSSWPYFQIRCNAMSEGEAVSFLKGYLYKDEQKLSEKEEINLRNLTQKLDYFPLALAQAAEYISQCDELSIEDFLSRLLSYPNFLLDENLLSEYPNSMAKTWLPTLELIKHESPLALNLLKTCSEFKLPIPSHSNRKLFDHLLSYSMVSLESDKIIMNSFVQQVMKSISTEKIVEKSEELFEKKTMKSASPKEIASRWLNNHLAFWQQNYQKMADQFKKEAKITNIAALKRLEKDAHDLKAKILDISCQSKLNLIPKIYQVDDSLIQEISQLYQHIHDLGEAISQYIADHGKTGEIPITWKIPSFNPKKFIPRPKLQQDLLQKFQSDPQKLVKFSYCGLRGMGKTQLALSYIHLYPKRYSAYAWFDASSKELLDDSYKEFCSSFNISIENNQSTHFVVKTVKNWAEMHPGWLFVYDNVSDVISNLISDYLPRGGGHILMTSIYFSKLHCGTSKEVHVFEEKEAVSLLKGCGDDEKNLMALAKTLDYFPLALAQASI